jgi:hypothetical protein
MVVPVPVPLRGGSAVIDARQRALACACSRTAAYAKHVSQKGATGFRKEGARLQAVLTARVAFVRASPQARKPRDLLARMLRHRHAMATPTALYLPVIPPHF